MLLSFSLALHNISFATEEKSIPDDEFQRLLKEVQIAPDQMTQDKEVMGRLSNAQLTQVVKSFNVSHYNFLHPMEIKLSEMPNILNREFKELSLMAVWSDKLIPIPFQFDEYDNKSNYIYIPKVNKDPIDGTYLVADPNDELVFMYRDAGETAYQPESMKLSEGNILQEITLKSHDGTLRYAYLVENNPLRSEGDYISTDVEKSQVVSSFYHISYDKKNFLNYKDVRPYVGTAANQRVIDNIYFKLSANIFGRLVKVGMNSADNVRVKILGVKDGPVRSTALVKLRLIFGKIPLFSMQSELIFYEQGVVMPNRTEVGKGEIFAKIFKNAEILMYIDMNGIEGGKVSAESFIDEDGNRLYGHVDGRMDAQEMKAAEAGLPGEWAWIDSGLGWDIFISYNLPMELLDGMDISAYYEDDKDSVTKFESFPGAGPRIGVSLKGMPKDMKALETIEMEYSFWFPDTVGENGPEDFYFQQQNPPGFSIKALQ